MHFTVPNIDGRSPLNVLLKRSPTLKKKHQIVQLVCKKQQHLSSLTFYNFKKKKDFQNTETNTKKTPIVDQKKTVERF